MKKCIISLHSGIFIYGDSSEDDKQNDLIEKQSKLKIIRLNFPKDNFKETFQYLEKKIKFYAKKYKVYLIGRSSGGYLAKQLFNKYSKLIEKVIYLAPCFNPKKRQEINPRFSKVQDYFFRYSNKIPNTNSFNPKKEFIFLAKDDKNIPLDCFTKEQKRYARFFNKTHQGLVYSTDKMFIGKICKILQSKFKKYSTCGNTFIVTDIYPNDKDFIIEKCKEYNVDGFIWYAIEKNSRFTFKWNYWNNNGTKANMCSNGSIAVAYHISNLLNMNQLFFKCSSGILQTASIHNDCVRVSIPKYKAFQQIDNCTYRVNVGVDHTVRYISHENFDTYNLEGFYNKINKTYRSNVSIVVQCSRDTFKIRTFEKEVEAETGACGTACLAAYYSIKDRANPKHFQPTSKEEIVLSRMNGSIYISSKVKEL